MDTIILFYIISGIVVIILLWILMTEIRLKKIFTGTKARNLEEMIVLVGKKINEMEEKEENIDKHLVEVDNRLNKSIRNIETIRFNPFIDAGSNQSFAIALMNDEGNGVVMSSLYARDRMSIFAKPIVKGKSDFELSSEEKEVLEKALK
ncbi:MAG TPA: DUF4446 family protein [Candidatus Paceibacterota bacterium]|nr:DUF4446 family protein [Candidatus Paceibacterota bacterium]